jgi:hypothetical protein
MSSVETCVNFGSVYPYSRDNKKNKWAMTFQLITGNSLKRKQEEKIFPSCFLYVVLPGLEPGLF